MKKNQTFFSVVLLVSIYTLLAILSRYNLFTHDLTIEFIHNDAESMMASGERIPLRAATLYDLILISGISDTTAMNILTKRDEILALSESKTEPHKHKALELAKGIGVKKAHHLSSLITLDSNN